MERFSGFAAGHAKPAEDGAAVRRWWLFNPGLYRNSGSGSIGNRAHQPN